MRLLAIVAGLGIGCLSLDCSNVLHWSALTQLSTNHCKSRSFQFHGSGDYCFGPFKPHLVEGFSDSDGMFLLHGKVFGKWGISKRKLEVYIIVNIFFIYVESVEVVHSGIKVQDIELLGIDFDWEPVLFEHSQSFVGFLFEYINVEVCLDVPFYLVLIGPYSSLADGGGLLPFQLVVVSKLDSHEVCHLTIEL